MSRRTILNISSKKKRNAAPPVNFNYQGLSPTTGSKVMGSDRVSFLLWRPTALASYPDVETEASRNAQQVYWRGVKEQADLMTSSGAAWKWRRIIFEVKGLAAEVPNVVSNVETSNGYPRAIVELSGDPPAVIRNGLERLIFQGVAPSDWSNVFNAKVDTNRVKLHYDKTRHLQSGNDRGRFYSFKQWMPFNKNFTYDDEERGTVEKDVSSFAALGRSGMGDVYVFDMFACQLNDDIHKLSFNPQATMYWHER